MDDRTKVKYLRANGLLLQGQSMLLCSDYVWSEQIILCIRPIRPVYWLCKWCCYVSYCVYMFFHCFKTKGWDIIFPTVWIFNTFNYLSYIFYIFLTIHRYFFPNNGCVHDWMATQYEYVCNTIIHNKIF